ncbi:SMI1/KNR4 family protein [Chryseobacterium indologenes]|uniref:SMI1/KNR4 family protein n=1 Tax=Chryseobacterium indologenes TaxID=253 RepID=UPI000A583CA6|nr:SMI1/KNR4 family protein [Chryseobacterium indologenes]
MQQQLPMHWHSFIKVFKKKYNEEIVYGICRIFRDEEAVWERYDTYDFEQYLPCYIPVADDSGGRVAVISIHENDKKVYLSDYGVLQESELSVLDRDLMHWMQRKFPFDPDSPKELSKENVENFQQLNHTLYDEITRHTDILNFLKAKIRIEGMSLPENYGKPKELYFFQQGYRYNFNGEDLTGLKPGDFKPTWLVLATNYFDDPFFIDLEESKRQFPVYFAFHGQGEWIPVMIADSVREFEQQLIDIQTVQYDREALIDYLKKVPENEFWNEVREVAASMSSLDEEEAEEKISALDWQKARLYITDTGPNKIKIISLLKAELNISGPEALQLSRQPRILFSEAYFKWIKADIKKLESLGAKTEIEFITEE